MDVRPGHDVVVATGSTMNKHFTARVKDRGELRFVETVQIAFNFLVHGFGFRLERSEPPTFVRYESDTMFFNVYHGRQSYELNVEMGRIADPGGRSFCLRDVLDAILGKEDKRQVDFQASDPEGVRRCVEEMADLVARYYTPLLAGDTAILDHVAMKAAQRSRTVTREVVQRPVRELAEKAWQAKEYAKVRELYGSILDSLTRVERKRLEYAERHDPS